MLKSPCYGAKRNNWEETENQQAWDERRQVSERQCSWVSDTLHGDHMEVLGRKFAHEFRRLRLRIPEDQRVLPILYFFTVTL